MNQENTDEIGMSGKEIREEAYKKFFEWLIENYGPIEEMDGNVITCMRVAYEQGVIHGVGLLAKVIERGLQDEIQDSVQQMNDDAEEE